MTERIAHRELRNRSAEVLRDVAAGATYEITNRGEVVAVLSPPRREAAWRIRAARQRGGFTSLPRLHREQSSADVVTDLRGER